jgi:hypothetical protein
MNRSLKIILLLLLSYNISTTGSAESIDTELLIKYVSTYNIEAVKKLGPDVMPLLADLYIVSHINQKKVIANIFYQLKLESEIAENALMQDINTDDEQLSISIQNALDSVSSDQDVGDSLLENTLHDRNAYFRDKAECNLAYDQTHLSDEDKVPMYECLINGLSSSNKQVRSIAIKALKIHTGQTKEFDPGAILEERHESIKRWENWIEEYKENI